MHDLLARLFPLCRSLTGDGVRRTLEILAEDLPLVVTEVPSGTPIHDWSVPREWNLRGAWIAGADGQRVVDAEDSNLHVVSYSTPVRARMSLDELGPTSTPFRTDPSLIPYRTSYWHETWGFCLAHETLEAMPDGTYDVVIDAALEDGSLTYAEVVLPGREADEAIVVTHVCHPSMANDNLSGVVVAATLARLLAERDLRYTWRFLFCPATVGSIAWLAGNPDVVPRLRHGLACVSVGDPGPLTYKPSRRGDAEVDRAALHVLRHRGGDHRELPYVPWGCDERQFTSPGYDVPMGALMRTPPGTSPRTTPLPTTSTSCAPRRSPIPSPPTSRSWKYWSATARCRAWRRSASPSSAGGACSAPPAAPGWAGAATSGRCSGCSTRPTGPRRSSTSPIAPACPSDSSTRRRRSSSAPDCWRRPPGMPMDGRIPFLVSPPTP